MIERLRAGGNRAEEWIGIMRNGCSEEYVKLRMVLDADADVDVDVDVDVDGVEWNGMAGEETKCRGATRRDARPRVAQRATAKPKAAAARASRVTTIHHVMKKLGCKAEYDSDMRCFEAMKCSCSN